MISTPEQAGYDTSDGMTGNLTGGMPKSLGVPSGNHHEGPPHFIDNDDPKRTVSVTESAIQFMRDQHKAGNPFYVQVSYYAVHLSVVTRQSLLRKYQQKGQPDRGYIQAWAGMMEELYDLNVDLAETKDLARQKTTLADSLQKQLLAHLEDVDAETLKNAGKK